MPFPASRLADIAPFHVVELFQRSKQLEAEGRSVVHMELGEPDFGTPAPIIDAALEFLKSGMVHYTPSLGLPELRQAISDFYRERYGVSVPSARIVVTAGASGALTLALGCLVEPGSEWLITDPGYPCNRHFIRTFEGTPRGIRVGPESRFQPTVADLELSWNPRTAGALLASPANPTGTLLTGADLAGIAAFVRGRDGCLIVDEIYHGLTYEDAGEARPQTALAFGDDIFVVQSFSKYFSMTGWRLGWLVVPERFVRDVEKLAQNLFIAPSTPAQYAALAAFRPETIALLEARREEFRRRRDFLAPAVEALGFRLQSKPEGAFYLYADCSALTDDSFAFARDALEHTGVALTPGIDFGDHGAAQHIRFAYTTGMTQLADGVERLHAYLGT